MKANDIVATLLCEKQHGKINFYSLFFRWFRFSADVALAFMAGRMFPSRKNFFLTLVFSYSAFRTLEICARRTKSEM